MDKVDRMETKKIEVAMRHYESQRKANAAYHERKRQAKREAGTLKPRGRPPKIVKPQTENGLILPDPSEWYV
jgi:hypothetical protein